MRNAAASFLLAMSILGCKTQVEPSEFAAPIKLEIQADGLINLDGRQVDMRGLAEVIEKNNRLGRDTPIVITSKSEVQYRTTMEVLDLMKRSGRTNIGLITGMGTTD